MKQLDTKRSEGRVEGRGEEEKRGGGRRKEGRGRKRGKEGEEECFADLLVTQLRQLVAQVHALLKKHCGPSQTGHEASPLCVLAHHRTFV